MFRYNYIAIEGNIGAGKTTLSTLLAHEFNAQLVLEQFEDNAFLPLFYKDAAKYAFPLEVSFLEARYRQLEALSLARGKIVADYYLGKCLVFAQNNLSSAEFDLFSRLYEILNAHLPKPDLLIFLDEGIETLMQRIAKRGRSYELDIKTEYLLRIHQRYMEFLSSITDFPVLVIDCSKVDLVNNLNERQRFVHLISQVYKPGLHHILC